VQCKLDIQSYLNIQKNEFSCCKNTIKGVNHKRIFISYFFNANANGCYALIIFVSYI